MRRFSLALLAALGWVWIGVAALWATAEKAPSWLLIPMYSLFAPGYAVAMLANRVGLSSSAGGVFMLLFYLVNAAVWTLVFYALATLYVRRKEHRHPKEVPPSC